MVESHAFGVQPNPVYRKRAIYKPHVQAVIGLGGHRQLVRQARSFDHERMIARGLERRIEAAKDTLSLVSDHGELAMDLHRSAHHAAPESLSDRLMAETNAEHRDRRGDSGDELEADAGVARCARAGR